MTVRVLFPGRVPSRADAAEAPPAAEGSASSSLPPLPPPAAPTRTCGGLAFLLRDDPSTSSQHMPLTLRRASTPRVAPLSTAATARPSRIVLKRAASTGAVDTLAARPDSANEAALMDFIALAAQVSRAARAPAAAPAAAAPKPPTPPPQPQCLICMSDVADSSPPICQGGHVCCTDCTVQFVRRAVSHNVPTLRCPDTHCTARLQPATIVRAVQISGLMLTLGAEVMALVNTTDGPATVFPLACPVASCGGRVYLASTADLADLTTIDCPLCHASSRIPKWQRKRRSAAFTAHQQRITGKPQAAGNSAITDATADRRAASEQQLWQDLFVVFNTRRCPRCRIVVERMSGCDHMTCQCGAYFCWQCQHPIPRGARRRYLGSHDSALSLNSCAANFLPDHPVASVAIRSALFTVAALTLVGVSPLLLTGAAIGYPAMAIRRRIRAYNQRNQAQ